MEHHFCSVPAPGESIDLAFHCRECGWNWRLNTIVWRWFRDAPERKTRPAVG